MDTFLNPLFLCMNHVEIKEYTDISDVRMMSQSLIFNFSCEILMHVTFFFTILMSLITAYPYWCASILSPIPQGKSPTQVQKAKLAERSC